MSDEMLKQIMLIEAGGRGTGRTTRAVNSLREWAVAHPDLTGVMVTHDASFASTLKQRHFDDLPNVRVVGIGQSQSLRGQHIGALEIDHFAMKRMVMDLEASRTKLRAERDALKDEVVGRRSGLHGLLSRFAHSRCSRWRSTPTRHKGEVRNAQP